MKDLVEVDEFTTPVTVPEGIDSRDDAAGDVERIAQALTNRTQHLSVHGALTGRTNVFTQGQQFDVRNAAVPMLESLANAGDALDAPANVWKLQLQFEVLPGLWVRLFSGNDASGHWAITSNAGWDPSAGGQQWVKDDPAKESNVLRCFSGELHWYGKAPGGAPWGPTGWDMTRGVMKVGDNLLARDLFASNLFKYAPARSSWVQATPDGGYNQTDGVSYFTRLNAGQKAYWHFRVPSGAVLGQVNIKLLEYVNSQWSAILYRVHNMRFDNAVGGTFEQKAVIADHVVGTQAVVTKTMSYGGITADNEFESYFLVIASAAAAATYLDVLGMQIGFSDPGPRNH